MIRQRIVFFTAVFFCFVVNSPASFAADYTLSMLPRYSTEEIHNRIKPLAEYLSQQTGLQITPTLTSTFDQYSKQLSNGSIDIGFENPYIYVLASEKHQVVAMAVKGKDGDKFRGIIISRSDSQLKTIEDLRGKKVSIVGYTSAGGYLSQKLTLLEHGLVVNQDCVIEEAPDNKQENVAFSVYTGDVDAGFLRESALQKVEEFIPHGTLRVLAHTAWLPNWALSLSRKLPPEDREKIIQAIAELEPESPVLEALKIDAFRPAQDSEYNDVRKAAGLALPEETTKSSPKIQ